MVVLFVAMVASRVVAMAGGAQAGWLLVFHGLARTGFALAVMGLLAVALARTGKQSLWQRPGLDVASFDLYLLHFPPVIVLQYALVGTELPIVAKFVVCFLVPAAACLGFGRLFGRQQRLTVPVIAAVAFVLCLVVWG
ncbi:hypothetical protein DVDV_2201 [Desulfovibrio sp. DV]|nr:hypothetical protein DVDV_2201 [Desulfovibrio sp. DV]